MEATLKVQDLSVRYRGHYALEKIDFDMGPGQMVGIMGPNGAGKSTLVKGILGLVPVSSGRVRFRGHPLRQALAKISYVPQRVCIDWDYPTTVWNVVMMGRTVKTGLFRRPSRQSRELVELALKRVGVWDLRDRQIGELSGGQQQRVFIARSLAKEAELLIFDEPFTGVDRRTEEIVFDIFQDLKAEGKSILVINHDLGEALNYYDKLLLLNRTAIAYGHKQAVLTADNIRRAYGIAMNMVAA